jgi:hypothetical protein
LSLTYRAEVGSNLSLEQLEGQGVDVSSRGPLVHGIAVEQLAIAPVLRALDSTGEVEHDLNLQAGAEPVGPGEDQLSGITGA